MPQRTYVKRVLLTLGLAALLVIVLMTLGLAWTATLTLFGGALFGVFLNSVASSISRWTKIPRKIAIGLVVVISLAALVSGLIWLGPQISERSAAASDQFGEAWTQIVTWAEDRAWGRRALTELGKVDYGSFLSGHFSTVLSSTMGSLISIMLMFLFGLYFAIDPQLYLRGAEFLVPRHHRDQVQSITASLGEALRSWLMGRITMMAVVGVGTSIGLWAVGVPLALPLGMLAGLLAFVPNLGPLLAMAPGVILSLSVDLTTTISAIAVYVLVQIIEGYLITPMIQQHVVSMPPALLMGFQLFMGAMGGIVGLFMATPLLVTIVVLVQAFYVRDVLGEDLTLVGCKEAGDEGPIQLELDFG